MATPVLDLDANDSSSAGTGYVTTFTENGSPVAITDSDVSITMSNGTIWNALIGGTGFEGDSLAVIGPLPDGITASSSGGGGLVLSKAGGASPASYQLALQQIVFSNSSHNPNTTDRTISISVTDNSALVPRSNNATATIHIIPIDDAPVAQDGSFHGSEDTVISNALVATDVDNTQLSYIVVNQPAHGLVSINANGVFSYTPNTNFNGADSFRFKANDGTLDSNAATISLTVFPAPDAPVVTSNGGGDTATVSMPENTTVVTTNTAADPDGGSISWMIVGGSDRDKFLVDASTGVLSFIPVEVPDFEKPRDSDHNNSYVVQVRAFNGNLSDDQTITVNVTDVPEPPVITSNGGGDTATVSIKENDTAVTVVTATDPAGSPITYSIIGGSDQDKFLIDPTVGVLSFNPVFGPDFETPSDSDHNNSYVVQVRAFDGSLADDQTITVNVTDIPGDAPSRPHWVQSVNIGAHPPGWLPSGFGDVNADGTSDVFWYNASTGGAESWKIQNGQWAGSVGLGTHPGGYNLAGNGDFNHDGMSDVLWFNPATNATDIWLLNNGQWAGSTSLGNHPAGYQAAGIGDFNHDGTSDVLWFNPSNNATDIWAVNNGQWAGSTSLGNHPAGYNVAGIGDFNHDGTSDVLWFNPATGATDIWLVNNGQWAGSTSIGAHPAGWVPIGTGDFNQDGTSDAVWYNSSTNNVEVWLVNNGQWAGSVNLGSHPAGSQLMGIGDFDHNGVSDLMWRDSSNGSIETWLMAYS